MSKVAVHPGLLGWTPALHTPYDISGGVLSVSGILLWIPAPCQLSTGGSRRDWMGIRTVQICRSPDRTYWVVRTDVGNRGHEWSGLGYCGVGYCAPDLYVFVLVHYPAWSPLRSISSSSSPQRAWRVGNCPPFSWSL